MARLTYSAIHSLDGYVADRDGRFEWAEPDEEVHTFVNDLDRPVGTYLYGRRMYEVLVAWETMHTVPDQPASIYDFADIWRAADKIVYSATLEEASSARTRIERSFDADVVRRLKGTADRDLTIGGPTIATRAFEAGLVDECRLFVAPRPDRRRHAVAPRRRLPAARAPGRAKVREWLRLPRVPRHDVDASSTGSRITTGISLSVFSWYRS